MLTTSKNQLSTEKVHLLAVDKKPSSMKNFKFSNDDRFTGGLPEVLTVAIGARVILTRNIDVSDGLANGTQGIIIDIKFLPNNKPVAVIILFDSPNVGKNARLDSKFNLSPYKAPVVPILQIEATFSPTSSKATVSRKQFPLRLCWATSIHKIQGATLDNIVVSFDNRFNSGQAYVALSRVKKLENLFLTSFYENKITTSSKVRDEMNRLQQEALHPNPFAVISEKSSLKLALLNTRSAKNHFTDILANPVLSKADIVCLTESNVYTDQIKYYERPGWTLKFLGKSPTANCHGLLFYTRENLSVVSCMSSYVPHMEQLNIVLSSEHYVKSICLIYRSPSTPAINFIADVSNIAAERTPDVILGDFNVDVNSTLYTKLSEELQTYQQTVSSPTYLSESTFDLVFVKKELPQPSVTVFPTYFSDHSIVYLQFK